MTLTPISPADLPEVVALLNRCHVADGPNIRIEVDEFRQELNSSLTTMSRDVRIHRDDGRVTGVVWTLHRPSSESPQRCDVEGYVDPTMRGRGLGRKLLTWGADHARELLTSVPGHPVRAIRTSRTSTNLSAEALHRELGFTEVRWFDDLERSLVDIPTPVRVPGITFESWPSDDESVRRVKNTAFTDHWGSVPTTIDGWREMVHGYAGRPDLSSIARDQTSGHVVGLLLTRRYPADDEVTRRREAWINTLGTLSSHRGRGIATALLIEALHRYRDHGMTHAMIGVDADNPSGAHRLYRSLGFSDHVRLVTSEIVLS
jgi:mycothiol synthase